MPKARDEKILSDDGKIKVMQVEVGQRGETKLAEYKIPSNAKVFQEAVLSASDKPPAEGEESELDRFYRYHVASADRYARAAVYVSLAQASTYITVGKDRINLMDFPLDRFTKAYNGMLGSIDAKMLVLGDDSAAREKAEDNVGFGPWKVAAGKHLATTDDKGNTLTPKVKMLEDGKLALV